MTGLERRTPLRKQSRKYAALTRVYRKHRLIFLEANPLCERCGQAASEVHHKAGRVGGLLLDQRFWMAACRPCHLHITGHPASAIAEGWSLPRVGVPEDVKG